MESFITSIYFRKKLKEKYEKMNQLCVKCHGHAKFVCVRCNLESYCSKICQVHDFPRHRFECFSLPALKLLEEPTQQIVNVSAKNSPEKSQKSIADPEANDAAPLTNVLSNDSIKQVAQEKQEFISEKMQAEKEEEEVESKQEQNNDEVQPAAAEVPNQTDPVLNQGIRPQPANNFCKPPSSVSSARSRKPAIDKEVMTGVNNFSIEKVRRNQQTVLTNQSLITPKENRVLISDIKGDKQIFLLFFFKNV